MRLCLIILFFKWGVCFSQTSADSIKYHTDPSIFINRVSTHPFGIFISRINHNFQTAPARKTSLIFNISNGNVWLPYVKAYFPLSEADRNAMRKFVWHEREGNFNKENTPSQTMEFHADGIIRLYQLKLNIPLSVKQEMSFSARAFSVDPGKVPYSLLTSDQFIEWYHSNLSRFEDPFARKVYGYNKVKIQYTDKKGKELQLKNGDFIFSGFEISYYYYPAFKKLEKNKIYTNLGLQLGVNTTSINPSADLGLDGSVIKQFNLVSGKQVHFGISAAALHQKLASFGQGVQLSNNKYLISTEMLLDYILPLKHKSYVSFTTTYFIQSSYNKKSERDYYVLTGDRISTHWHYSISHLYRALTANYFIITLSKGDFTYSVYAREDLLVDNAPDVQTGIGFKMNFR
jgi:hypothetical protein